MQRRGHRLGIAHAYRPPPRNKRWKSWNKCRWTFCITDLRVPQIGGLELLKRVREAYPQTAVLVLTQYGTIESAVEATRLGAADYITKPFHIPELRGKLDRMVRVLNVDQENRVLRETLRTRPGFRGLDRRFAENAARLQAD